MRRAPTRPNRRMRAADIRRSESKSKSKRQAASRLLVEPLGLGERRHIDTGEGPLHRERLHLRAELLDELEALLALRGHSRDAHEVLEQLRAGLLLQEQRELHGAVQEVGNDLDIVLAHVARRQRGRAETDATGDLCGRVARDGVFCGSA